MLDDDGGIAGDDDIGRDAFRDDGSGGDDGVFADGHAFPFSLGALLLAVQRRV